MNQAIKDIEWIRGDRREYIKLNSYDHLLAVTDPTIGFTALCTGKNCSQNRDTYNRAVKGERGDDRWRYGSEGRAAFVERTNNRYPDVATLKATRENLKGHLNSKDVIRLRKQMMSERKRRVFSETDGVINIPRVLSGNIDYFVRRKKKKIIGIKVGMKGTLTCNFGEKDFLDMVSSLIITARMLEFVGIPVELYYIADSQGTSYSEAYDRQGVIFPLKKGGERLNLHKVCMIGSTGHFRHHVFAAWAAHLTGEMSWGLGTQADFEYDKDAALLGLDVIIGKEFMRNDPVEVFNFITKQVFS